MVVKTHRLLIFQTSIYFEIKKKTILQIGKDNVIFRDSCDKKIPNEFQYETVEKQSQLLQQN